jgi:hypothetical protein
MHALLKFNFSILDISHFIRSLIPMLPILLRPNSLKLLPKLKLFGRVNSHLTQLAKEFPFISLRFNTTASNFFLKISSKLSLILFYAKSF